MESAGIIMGMIAAFLLGAWVRTPFSFSCKKKREKEPAEKAEEPMDARLKMQMENLLNYGIAGRKQREIYEDED